MRDSNDGEDKPNPAADNNEGWIPRNIRSIKRQLENRRAKYKEESSAEKAARSTSLATWALVFFTVALGGVGYLQYTVIRDQLAEMRGGSEDTKRIAKATQEQATQNRARLWIASTDLPTRVEGGGTVSLAGSFEIANYGPTPAIITGFTAKLFWTRDEPDPYGAGTEEMTGVGTWPSDEKGEILTIGVEGRYTSIPGNRTVKITKRYNFIPSPDYLSMSQTRGRKWLLIVVKYKDIYDIDRETSFYGRPPGIDPSERYPQYNYRK